MGIVKDSNSVKTSTHAENSSETILSGALKQRPWLLFSSSTGQTFRSFYSALGSEAQNGILGFFTDRPCAAATIARQSLEEAPVYELEKSKFEEFVLEWIEKKEIQDAAILLCGFFGILSEDFLERCPFPVFNTHPSLLPAFPGLDKKVQKKAWEQVPISGFTVHMVNASLDGGPILFQQPVAMNPAWNEEEARDAVREAEQRWLPMVWEQVLNSRISKEDVALSGRELRQKHYWHLPTFVEQARIPVSVEKRDTERREEIQSREIEDKPLATKT
jgi:folate-dependent phosphoribosylglycinamide formyltransferase PurN